MRHPASKCNTPSEGLRFRRARWYEPSDSLASICNRDFVPFSHLGNQRGQILSSFTNASFFHGFTVLHVAPLRNYQRLRQHMSPAGQRRFRRTLFGDTSTGAEENLYGAQSSRIPNHAPATNKNKSLRQESPNWIRYTVTKLCPKKAQYSFESR